MSFNRIDDLETIDKIIFTHKQPTELTNRTIIDKTFKNKSDIKEYEKDLKIACENDLRQAMLNKFEHYGYEIAILKLQLLDTRNEIIKDIATSDSECSYLNKIYESTLTKVRKIYKNDLEAKEKLAELEPSEELTKADTIKSLLTFLGILLLVLGCFILAVIHTAIVIGVVVTIIVIGVIISCAFQ